MYGIQGANGVLVITTKRGQPGRTKIEASFDQSFQQWITHPRIYSSWEYATMRRQAAINDGLSGDRLPFTEEQIAQFKSGENRELYPDNDWYHMFMKRLSSQQRVNVNVSGGNDNVRFFSNVSFLHQGSWFKTENEKYKSNPNFTWFNYRTNVDVKLNKYLSGYVNLSGNIRRERTPDNATYSLYGIYQSLFIVPPTTPGPLTPDGKVVVTQDYDYPAYGRLNRAGFTRTTVTNINSQVGLNLDMSFLTKGLSLSGVFAYQTNANGYHITTQSYEKYRRTDDYNVLEFVRKGSDIDTPLSVSKGSTEYYHLDGIVHLDYARKFGRHSVSAMGYMLYQSLSQQYTGSGANNLNYKRLHSGFQATYGYDDRYLVKFDLGYSGSDQFARDHRFMATPSVSGAWVASNEAFLRDSRWLTLLKIRASYGKTANDLLDSQRFSYMDDVRQVRGGTVTAYRYVLQEGLIGNPLFEAEVSKKQNYGIDIGLFNSLTLSLDYFKERMDNMVVQAIARIPAYQGVPLGNYPKTNVGKFENHGVDLSLGFTKQINKDWRVFAYGTFTWADNKVIDVAEAIKDEGYVYRHRTEGFPVGTQFGYVTDGYYNTQGGAGRGTRALVRHSPLGRPEVRRPERGRPNHRSRPGSPEQRLDAQDTVLLLGRLHIPVMGFQRAVPRTGPVQLGQERRRHLREQLFGHLRRPPLERMDMGTGGQRRADLGACPLDEHQHQPPAQRLLSLRFGIPPTEERDDLVHAAGPDFTSHLSGKSPYLPERTEPLDMGPHEIGRLRTGKQLLGLPRLPDLQHRHQRRILTGGLYSNLTEGNNHYEKIRHHFSRSRPRTRIFLQRQAGPDYRRTHIERGNIPGPI